MIDVSELLNDPDFCRAFLVSRTTGNFEPGGRYVTTAPVEIPFYGAIQPSSSNDKTEYLKEGERSEEMKTIWTKTEIFATDENRVGDMVLIDGQEWRVIGVRPWLDNGYYKTFIVRAKTA